MELSEQFKAWAKSKSDLSQLEEMIGAKGMSRVFMHIWVLPSFDPKTSYFIYNKHKQVEYPSTFVKEIIWDTKYEATLPIILKSHREAELDKKALENLINEGKNVRLPIITSNNLDGLDGTTYGIKIRDSGMRQMELEWWEDIPFEWSEFFTWFHKLRKFLIDTLEKQSLTPT